MNCEKFRGGNLAKYLVAEVSNNSFQDGMVGMTLVGKGHAMFDDLFVEEIP